MPLDTSHTDAALIPAPSSATRDPALLIGLAEAALAAGAVVMRIRAEGFEAGTKADESPVTAADLASEELLRARLEKLLPGVPVIAEEAVSQGRGETPGATFLLVDPLDGTREFIAERGEFTINIGLVEDGVPTLGALYAPAVERLYVGGPEGAFRADLHPGATAERQLWRPIGCRIAPASDLIAVASRSHLDADTERLLDALGIKERVSCGSALKLGLVAEGLADIYPRLSPVCEWDLAAGHAILRAAGGSVTRPDGVPIAYGRTNERYIVPAFLARGRIAAAA
ncbi:3'(2'),5'-bisphosphate nucleotidase CysQ [Starkeya sp. ORNL1]|uniref:3'(2'),5'-bisphosphate nucleotidase CysQ n=1 Tax=Starkeya sp. ORNL1 TaxID=2709380 RepID=UPI001463A809|nr:3'(2'),5'-bisphosphate nucleotidase CysQ [Starkeya sp. ORNL1]QJP17037.1 3'(2'),5'-bisphosphate nucleotidase CysQ [Starkeya sp. ORNL1]